MTEKEIEKRVEKDIVDYLKSFPDSSRETAEEMMVSMQVCVYIGGAISKEDLIAYAKYLGYDLNMEKIEEDKEEFYREHPELRKGKE